MPRTDTPRTASRRVRNEYEAAKAAKGPLSSEAQRAVRRVKGQAAADSIGRARKASRSYR